jgi:hypothetical protein
MPADIVDRVFQGGESRLVPDEEGEVDVEHDRRTIGVHTQPEGGHGGVDLSEIPEMDGHIPIPGAMLGGVLIGVIGAASREPLVFAASDLKLLSAIAAIAAPTIDQAMDVADGSGSAAAGTRD